MLGNHVQPFREKNQGSPWSTFEPKLEMTLPGYAATRHSSEVSTTSVLVEVGDCGQMHGASEWGSRRGNLTRADKMKYWNLATWHVAHHPVMSALPDGMWLQDV